MRKPFLIALLSALILFGVVRYSSTEIGCSIPLTYHLGEIDEYFSLSKTEAESVVQQATEYWQKATGRDLFKLSKHGRLTISFVFDDRQDLANQENTQRKHLDRQLAQNEKLLKEVETLQTEYRKNLAAHQKRVDNYKKQIDDYNRQVRRYNDQGGAPSAVFVALEKQRRDLRSEAASLDRLATSLNKMAIKINELSDKGNKLIADYNRQVNRYNEKFGFIREFTQGDFSQRENRINIYKFSNQNELLSVLVHEFGHALGLGHVGNEEAVMYYLLKEGGKHDLHITEADKKAFALVCGKEETLNQRLHAKIKDFVTVIKNKSISYVGKQ